MTDADLLPPTVLKRKAVVYVRQSTQTQVQTNLESQRRQYDLVDEARRRGFRNVEVIDDDLGRSASGTTARPGFERLVAWLCAGDVGAVLCFDASRLARNGRDWHHLLELCGLVGARVIDLDGVYDPSCWRRYSAVRCAISRCFRLPDLSACIPAIVSAVSGNRKRLARMSRSILIAPLRMERFIQ
jgi:hypothetical protein